MWKPDTKRIAETVESAPSIFNSKPWWLDPVAEDRIDLHAKLGGVDRQRWDQWVGRPGIQHPEWPVHHPEWLAREIAISCGAALYNLRLAIRVAGHELSVWLVPDPERDTTLLASVEIVTGRIKKPTIAEQELYEAIWRRHTNRWPYTIVPAPLPIIVEMEGAAAQEGGSLRLLHNHQATKWMRLVAEADSDLASEHPDLPLITQRAYRLYRKQRDGLMPGVPPTSFGPGPKFKSRHPRTRKDFWFVSEKQRFERKHKTRLMALSTVDDQLLDCLRGGQGLQRAILTGTRYSVSAPYGLAAEYRAPRRSGVPARHHLLTQHDDLARYGLSVSFLTQPLECYDIECNDIEHHAKKRHWPWRLAEPRHRPWRFTEWRHWPWRWRFPELPQMVIRVGYATVPPDGPRPQPKVRPQGAQLRPDSEAGT